MAEGAVSGGYVYKPHERPIMPGSPANPDHPGRRKLFYLFIGFYLAIVGGFQNGLLLANLTALQGHLDLTPVESGWVTAVYSMTNACMSILLFKVRQEFGIQRFVRATMWALLLANFLQLFDAGYRLELVSRGISGIAASGLSTLAAFYLMQGMPAKARIGGLLLAIGISQVGLPLARAISPLLLADGNVYNLFVLQFAMSLVAVGLVNVLQLPQGDTVRSFGKLDLVTFPLLAVGVGLLCAFFVQGRIVWWTTPWLGGTLAAAILLIGIAFLIEHNRANPMLHTRWMGSSDLLKFALTGAAVTTYGADAITGVVNFITKRDFAGLEVTASEQITEQGDGNVFRVDATIGANFDDGRGNAVLSIGYQQADPVYQGARPFSVNQVDSYTGGTGGSGTSVPSRFSGTRPLLAGGTPNITPESVFVGRNPDGTPIYAANPGGAANGGVRQVNAAGQAVGTFQTFNFNPFNIFQTPFERFNIYGQANYEVSDAVEVYTRGMFSKQTVSTIIAPSGSFGGSVPINLNNPFLPASLRAQLCAFDVNSRPDIYTARFSVDECAAAATATGRSDPNYREIGLNSVLVPFDVNNDGVVSDGEGYQSNPAATLNRRTPEVGPRISDYQTTFFDYRIGARGGITDTLDWSIEGAYGESENIQTIQGYTLQSRFREAALSNDGVTCQSGNAACVPVNLFGPEGSITPAMADYLQENSTSVNRTSLAQVRAIISGDLGFASPGAVQPIGFAIGGEYRKYKAQQQSDLLAKTAGELGGAGGAAPDIDGGYDVYEAYAEIVAPLIEDKPFFESLTLEAGIRYSDYSINGAGGYNTTTWKAGGSWEPGAGVKFRGNYSRAVRAPNIGELFTPTSVGLTNLGIDPCAGTGPTLPANANLRAVCIAQGAPAGTIGSITNPTAAQANITTGGNLNLQPEKADTWTLGVVWQPDFLPRFNMSIDYYNIKINDVLGTPLPGDIISACFDNLTAGSATDPACTAIRRNPLTGGLDGDPATTPGLFGTTNNLGRLYTDGVDLLLNYNADLGFASLDWSFVGNWTRHSKFKANAADPDSLNRECVGYYSVNCSFTGSIQPELQ
ncbi:MAG: TonB-dependent receptor domain-containing protein, partial [Sphingopyxis sp.]